MTIYQLEQFLVSFCEKNGVIVGLIMKTISTNYKGIRYREHASRRHGLRADRYFYIRYRLDGKLREEGWGWESEGFTAKQAFIEREKIMQRMKSGEEAVTLADQRGEAKRRREENQAKAEQQKMANISFGEFFTNTYVSHKEAKAVRPELSLYRMWIEPVIGHKTFSTITEFDLEKIRHEALKKGKALRTVQYCYAVVRQVFIEAQKRGVFNGQHPVSKTIKRKIKFDNRKMRFLSHDQAVVLLGALLEKSQQLHKMATLALYCGLRAGEIFSLEWCDVNIEGRTLTLRETKNKRTRIVPMPDQAIEIFKNSDFGIGNTPVFLSETGGCVKQISKTFDRVVDRLGFNENVTDRKNRVTFHTLRHTYASWLASQGVPLFKIQKLLGHSSIQMTERYSHACPDDLSQAVTVLSAMRGGGTDEGAALKVVNC